VLFKPWGGGGTEWSLSSYSQQTGFIYVTAAQQDTAVAVRQLPFVLGKQYLRFVAPT
jgi:hypothetical protein